MATGQQTISPKAEVTKLTSTVVVIIKPELYSYPSIRKTNFIQDSGASVQICNKTDFFFELEDIPKESVYLGNGVQMTGVLLQTTTTVAFVHL